MTTTAPDVLDRFRRAQRLAYACAEAVAATLVPGDTERDAARRMTAWLEDRGIDGWFHRPFAWFGDRTAFVAMRTPLAFFPSRRRLARGMPYILDVAPIVDGAAADIGYAACLGDDPAHARMLDDLLAYRTIILDGVRRGHTLRAIYAEVDRLAGAQGYRNRHRRYPFRVLAHKVTLVDRPRRTLAGFGLGALRELARERTAALWNDGRASDRPASPGVWAVEPHLGRGGVGVKFEELLVVTESGAGWLDDDLPHVRRHARGAAREARA